MSAEEKTDLLFCCRSDNDLYRVLASATSGTLRRCENLADAVDGADEGAGVLVLADGYPETTTFVDAAVFDRARARHLRLYVEYPSSLPGAEAGEPRTTTWQRGVVSSDAFGPGLEKLRILAIHGCHFVPFSADHPHLVVARVAGFDKAVYGLPDEVFPILFEHPRGDILVATTKLSGFLTARYAPREAWGEIWRMILGWLAPGAAIALDWTPTVRPSFGPDEELPGDAESEAFRRGAEWFRKSGMLLHRSVESKTAGYGDPEREDSPAPSPGEPAGDGSRGILEGYNAWIKPDGRQGRRLIRRGDCNAESAMAMVLAGEIAGDALYTMNFALLGLHEAAAATGDSFYTDAADKLAGFLCRVQVRSQVRPELDGAWFRAFDFNRWEYWASSGDLGWGAWCVETGWSQAWIVAVLGLRQMKTSLWDLTADSRIKTHFARLHAMVFPGGDGVEDGPGSC